MPGGPSDGTARKTGGGTFCPTCAVRANARLRARANKGPRPHFGLTGALPQCAQRVIVTNMVSTAAAIAAVAAQPSHFKRRLTTNLPMISND